MRGPRHLPRRTHLGRSLADPSRRATLSVYDPHEELPEHEHPSAHLCVMLAGGFTQWSGPAERHLRAGDVGIYPEGDGHRNLLGQAGAVCLNLHLPKDLAPAAFRVARIPSALRIAADDIAAALATSTGPDRLSIEALAAELVADPADGHEELPLGKVVEALEGGEDWSLGRLGNLVGRHPTHLARTFRKATGFTIGGYRRRLRLRNLCVDLRTDGAPLSELAARHGFSDQAHMTRQFRALVGTSPGAWRRAR